MMSAAPDPEAFREQNRAFWEDRGRSESGTLAVTLMAEHERFLAYTSRVEIQFLMSRLADRPAPRILDLGCGAGRLAVALAPIAREVVGIELAASLVERARRLAAEASVTNARFEERSVEDPLPKAAFDVVILSGVLNYIDDDAVARTLRQAAAALTPNGWLYIRNNCATRHRYYRPIGPGEPPCIYRTSEEYIRAVAATEGLAISEERYLYPPLCLPNLVYYHALPRQLRSNAAIGRVLDAWFAREERTGEMRLRLFGGVYPWIVRSIRKPTAFRILIAQRV